MRRIENTVSPSSNAVILIMLSNDIKRMLLLSFCQMILEGLVNEGSIRMTALGAELILFFLITYVYVRTVGYIN